MAPLLEDIYATKNLYLEGEDKLEWVFMRSKGFRVNNYYMVSRGGNSFRRQSTSKVHAVFPSWMGYPVGRASLAKEAMGRNGKSFLCA